MADKKSKKESARFSERTGTFTPFMIQIVRDEIAHSGSNSIMALAAAWDANDILHSGGLITNDAWNGKKGWFQTIGTADVFKNIGLPVLKTAVDLTKGRGKSRGEEEEGYSEADVQQLAAALAAAESANAEDKLEG